MTNILLSFISGILLTHLFFSHAINKDGSSAPWGDLFGALGMVVLSAAVFYGVAYLFGRLV